MDNRMEQVSHPLDLDEQPRLHRKGWIAQVIGKVLIIALMIAGLLGAFGEGWLSSRTILQGRTQLQYERFYRQDATMKLAVSQTGVAGRSAISFPLPYISQLEVSQVVPEPEQSFTRDGQLWYVFEADQNLLVTFHLRPKTRGNLAGSVYVNEDNIPVHHFIYP